MAYATFFAPSLSLSHPWALMLFALLPLLVLLGYMSSRLRRSALARWGQPEAVAQLVSLNRPARIRSRLFFLGAIALLIITLAGPRWGRGPDSIIEGRDLVVVLDLSKSMLTRDMIDPDHPERWQAAQAGIRDLVAQVRLKGGHRLGLVVFASKAWTICPLTADYDHFLMRLDEFSPSAPPPEILPREGESAASGTRIGAGILEGLSDHDPRFLGYQDLLLIGDGDDPGADRDDEIAAGVAAAFEAHIPVHVVGVGDPKNAEPVIIHRPMGDDDLVVSQLQEAPLEKIARQTRGEYRTWYRETPRLGDFFKVSIDPRPSRELPEDAIPQPKEQYPWFLGPALVFLLVAWRWEQ